jgi:hypothetical protein
MNAIQLRAKMAAHVLMLSVDFDVYAPTVIQGTPAKLVKEIRYNLQTLFQMCFK